MASSNLKKVQELKKNFRENFKMEERGELRWFLGIIIEKGPGRISLDQGQYIEDMLQKQGMRNCKLFKSPISSNEKFVKATDDNELADESTYRRITGSLLFLAKQTRPDILFGVNVLSRFMAKPIKALMNAVKTILRYLRGSSNLKIAYCKQSSPILLGEGMQIGKAIKTIASQTRVSFSSMVNLVVLYHGK